ncbi:hypothetical protein GCM10022393_36440 [Aquimarina addita]|uniref:Uncharacterized protein n=1 Tax=Aquimarina addita TaxID=870485 RepID=A0ABP6UU79_9FLAO
MDAINKIYSNEVGISFFWKKEEHMETRRVQMVFRDIGFLLTLHELKEFSKGCTNAKASYNCNQCADHQHCRSLLLRTPSEKIDLAVSIDELDQLQELINTTVFRVSLKNWVQNLCLN